MVVFKCKMCGGNLEADGISNIGVCQYCGSTMTLPRLNDEKKINLYDRANHFRRNDEFDKAMVLYETILTEYGPEAEAYWSILLCKYGVEYVEDPASHKRVITCNRTRFSSVFADEDYKQAIEHAEGEAKYLYEQEAQEIDKIQKNILEIAAKEDPFDIFICYKETDEAGGRTIDSVIAQELYDRLTAEGLKVFFSRITLERQLGDSYEPYIFAALNSAKIMIVLGTKPEHFNAVWVKNEWSRYLALIKEGKEKTLIPVYKDMDPYDLPEEFSYLQGQDMAKLGFMQDLLRGIKKILGDGTAEQEKPVETAPVKIESLLQRAHLFLEDCNWSQADQYSEKILDMDPQNTQAYMIKLMAELRITSEEQFCNATRPLEEYDSFKKAVRFADEEYKARLMEYNDTLFELLEKRRQEKICQDACTVLEGEPSLQLLQITIQELESIGNYKDAASLAQQCRERAEAQRKQESYQLACRHLREGSIQSLRKAIELFRTIPDYEDAAIQMQQGIEKLKRLELSRNEVRDEAYIKKRNIMIVAGIVAAAFLLLIEIFVAGPSI